MMGKNRIEIVETADKISDETYIGILEKQIIEIGKENRELKEALMKTTDMLEEINKMLETEKETASYYRKQFAGIE